LVTEFSFRPTHGFFFFEPNPTHGLPLAAAHMTYLVEDTETYLMCEGVVCDGACGGVDAQQPPHIDDPVR